MLFNTSGIDIGPELSKLKEFTAQFPPDMRGLAISNCDAIREAHNSFHRPEPFMPDEDKEDKSGEAFHFIRWEPDAGRPTLTRTQRRLFRTFQRSETEKALAARSI